MKVKDIVKTKWYSTPPKAFGEVVELGQHAAIHQVKVWMYDTEKTYWYDASQLQIVSRYQG